MNKFTKPQLIIFILAMVCVASLAITSLVLFIQNKNASKSLERQWKNSDGITLNIVVKGNSVELRGNAGVNLFTASYTLKNNKLYNTGVISTKMAGPEDLMETENAFLKFLEGTLEWSFVTSENKNYLTLIPSVKKIPGVMYKLKVYEFEEFVLEGTGWQYNNADIIFMGKDAIIHTGLNTVMLSYKTDTNSSLIFNAGPATLVSGSEEEMEEEAFFLNALNNCQKYTLDGKSLCLLNKEGQTLLVLMEKQAPVTLK